MEINNRAEQLLHGDIVSNGAFFSIKPSPMIERNKLLADLSKGKVVLHLGCADHLPLIKEKRKKGLYLHDLLKKSARQIIGADVNLAALEEMRSLGISDLYHINAVPSNIKYDLLLVPDVIEHVGNVQEFLQDLKYYNADRIVITTPNAYRLMNRILFQREFINTDHRYWFSPFSLAKCIYQSGFSIEKFYYTDRYSLLNPINNILKWRFPLCRDGLAVVVKSVTN